LDPQAPSKASSDAFTNYKPDWSLMPRISFSFPVSTNSLFYAHYNIITYRPTNLQIDPIAYLYIQNPRYRSHLYIISNPNLRAQRTVDYEIGFRQKVGENAALSFIAYYREQRDQIQSYRFTGAYPATYYSYYNQDFGTVQGFILGIRMRGAKNLSFNASYTLQFAKGTGSSESSNLLIIASGQPNLRTLTNLSFDQRHNISGTIDLRFDQGTNYNGPVTVRQKKGTDTKREIRWLENSGATLMVTAASGMPYSRSGIVYSALGWGERTNPQLKGSINGANMPWIFTCNLRLDKSFVFNLASKKDQSESGRRRNKPGMLTVYLDFQNLLNIKNVISVYDYTGNANDDGYLSSSLFRTLIDDGAAFGMRVNSAINYYEMAIANPYNFSQPFRVYLGIQFYF
jgi:outer membrane receptor protein involved in Fe transport